MSKQVKQFRYYKEGNSNNTPSNITMAKLVSGSIFQNTVPIVQLGIQSLPGTKFYLNGSTNPIIIGTTGIYELDTNDLVNIISLSFDSKSVRSIAANENAYLIVDIIYESEE